MESEDTGRKPRKRERSMLAVRPETLARLQALISTYMREYHLGQRCLPDALVDSNNPITMDWIVNHLIDYKLDHRERTRKANAKRSGARATPPADPPAEG